MTTPAQQWPHDDTAAMKRFYGNPSGEHGLASPAWEGANLVKVTFPWRAVLAWDTNRQIKACMFNKRAAAALEAVFADLWSHCGHDQNEITEAGLHLFGGTFNYRLKRGLSSLSVHAFGAAIDLDPARNPLGAKHGAMPRFVVDAFNAKGAVWGGDFKSRPDPMHFQFAAI